MNEQKDSTKLILEQLLSLIYKEQALETASKDASDLQGQSYLMGQDQQLLGKLTPADDTDSILNKYGPYGSRYSLTSIYNRRSPYGSQYGAFSLNNPYCSTPPQLFINGNLTAQVTVNNRLPKQIPTKTFFYLLEHEPDALISKKFTTNQTDMRSTSGESFILAEDGQFLGKLTSNKLDSESVLNETGPYGNEYSPTSIFNELGDYGNGFSSLSPFNPFSPTPPKIFVEGQLYGYLTENKSAPGAKKISPKRLKEWVKGNF